MRKNPPQLEDSQINHAPQIRLLRKPVALYLKEGGTGGKLSLGRRKRGLSQVSNKPMRQHQPLKDERE